MALEEAGVKLIAQGSSAYDADLKSATNATNTFVDATEKGGRRVSAAGQMMIGGLRRVGEFTVNALADAARATAAFAGDTISLAGDFEQGMLNFQAVAGRDVDTQGLEDFRDLFIDIGKRLPVSTTEVQKAATELVKGGIEPATVAAGGLESSIKFAAAAMEGDLVGAAEISAKIVGGWADVNATAAEKADLLAHSQDQLTKTANAATVGVNDLALGLFNSQGNAKLAGIGFDDLTTTLALIAPNFSNAGTAGTSLNAMIARLQPTTDPAAAAMASLGLYTEETGSAFYDAQGNFVGFEAAAQMLQDATNGLTDAQKQSTFQTIFGMDAQGAAAELTRQGAAGWELMAEKIAIANGVQENAAIKQKGFNTALDNAKGSVEAFQITIGSLLLPLLSELLDGVISPGINTLSDLASAVSGDDKAFAKLSPTMQGVTTTIQQLADDFTYGVQVAQDIAAEVDTLISTFATAEAESHTLGSAVNDLNGVWAKAIDVVGNVMDAYMNIAQAVLPIVTRFVDEHGEEIEAFFKTSWASVIEIVNLALDTYNAIVPPVLNAIAGFIDEHGSEIAKILSGAWTLITSIITGTLETIKGVFKVTLALLRGDWEGAWTGIKGIADAQVKAIEGAITGFLNIIAGLFDTTLDDIIGVWEDNWNMAVDIVSKIDWGQVGADVVSGIISGVSGAAGGLMRTLRNLASDALQAAKDALGISSPSKEFMAVGEFAVQGIMEGFSNTWPALTDLVGSISGDLIDDMKNIGRDMQDAIADGFGATASIDRQIAKNLDKFKDVLPQYEQYTTGALKNAQSQAEAFLDPAEGARFFKMRSDQILEYAKLQKELSEAETGADRERIEAQMLLINRAQTAEISQFEANQAGKQSATEQMADSINAVMAALAGINLTEDQIQIVGLLSSIWGTLQTPVQTRADAYAHPPMMATQYPSNSTTTNTSTQNVNMPIYTNNTPAALQQSWAVMQASMP